MHPALTRVTTSKTATPTGLTLLAGLFAGLLAPSAAQAQPTTTSLGTYTLCKTATAGQACHEVSLVTAPRLDANGVRNGTTGTLSLRNLQGSSFQAADGTVYGTGTGASVLREITLYTQGCLPNSPCHSPFFFDGLDFGRTDGGISTPASSGPVGGTVPAWGWGAHKPIAGDNPNTLRFVANSVYPGSGQYTNLMGLGGCTSGGGQLQGQWAYGLQGATTCAARGETGAAQFSFSTGFIFDPTYFIALRVDWSQQTTPGLGDYAPYFCGASANVPGQALQYANGDCRVQAGSIAAVPEPETYTLMAAGLACVASLARRRRLV